MVKDLAYFVQTEAGPGPGVLFLHSLWGLTPAAKRLCDDLADAGYSVLAPDLNLGELPTTQQEGLDRLGDANPDRLASLVLSSAGVISERAAIGPIGVVGFGMGGSLGLWASVRLADTVGAAVSFYGSQQIDFAGAQAAYLIHFADTDDFISSDEAAFMEATMHLESLDVRVERYPGTSHGFCEPESETFDPAASDRAWGRTLDFLGERLGR